MKDTITLKNPIYIDGSPKMILTYDTEQITGEQFIEAESLAMKMIGKNVKASVLEVDYSLHTYLGFASIIAINPEITIEELMQIKGSDNVKITRIGRDFIGEAAESDSEENASENYIDVIPEPITQASTNLDEEGFLDS
jgi:hypothetical protein